jgi:hypothetical protein
MGSLFPPYTFISNLWLRQCRSLDICAGVQETDLPKSPGAADVIAEGHGNQNQKDKYARHHGQLEQLGTVVDVHGKEHHQAGFQAGERQNDDRAENAKIDKRNRSHERRTGQQHKKHGKVYLGANNVVFLMFHVHIPVITEISVIDVL